MAIPDVCRLCLAEDNLVWVFDARFDNNDDMKTVVMLTTGVEIHKKDVISQKICTKCGQVAIKMFQFRENSLKNDKYLKDQCRNLLRDQDIKIPNTDVTIKTEKAEGTEELGEKKETQHAGLPYTVHPSLYALSKQYPTTHFPSICVKSHVSPIVSMEMDAVEKYFEARNLKMQDYVRLALRLNEPEPKSIEATSDTSICIVHQDLSLTAEDEREQNNNRVPPINIVKTRLDGYSVRNSVDESDPENNQKEHEKIVRKRRRRLSDDDLSESEPKKAALDPEVPKPTQSRLPCDVCSEVFDDSMDLKRHRNRHLRCQYCKSKCSSVAALQWHVDNACHHKKAMGNFPDIEVSKIENDALSRRNYPEAFKDFPPHPESATKAAIDVIELLSDDEDDKMSTKKFRPLPPKKSISIIKPDIKISDSTLLDKVGKQPSDVHQLKELLVLLQKDTKSDQSSQTDLPQNDSIKVDEAALTIDLAGLKHMVNHYKIPVKVTKFGPLKATYNYEVVKEKPKKLLYWNDLKPIDVKSAKKSVIQRNDRSSVPEVLNPKLTDEDTKPGYSCENKQYMQNGGSLFEKIADLCANIISASNEPAMPNTNASSIMELFLSGEKSNDVTIAPPAAQSMSLFDLLCSSETPNKSACVGATTPIPTQSDSNKTPSYATITLSNSSQIHSEVLLPKTSPNHPTLMHSNVLTRSTPPNNRHAMPSTILPRTSPNSEHPLSTQIHSNEPIRRTPPNNKTPMPPQIQVRTSPDIQPHTHAVMPPYNQNSMPYHAHPRMSPNNRDTVSSQSHSITSPNNQHPMPTQILPRTSPVIQPQSHVPDNQHSIPYHMHPKTSPNNQAAMPSQIPSITSPNNQPSMLSQIHARTSPNNQHPMPSHIHPRTSPQSHAPNNQHSIPYAKTSPNNQAAMPSQIPSITSPNNQPSMLSQIHAKTSPNNQHPMPSHIHPIPQSHAPNNQHSIPYAKTSPNNQTATLSQTLSMSSSPNNQPSVPSQVHSRKSPNNQPRGTPLNNQPCVTHQTHSNVNTTRHTPNNPPFGSVITRPNSVNNTVAATSHHSTMANSCSFDNCSSYTGMNQSVQHSQNFNRYYQHPHTNIPPSQGNYLNVNNNLALAQISSNYPSVWYPPTADYASVNNNGHVGNIVGVNYRGMTPNMVMYDRESTRFVPNQPSNRSNSTYRNDRMHQRPPPPSYDGTSWAKNYYKMPIEPLGPKDMNNSIRVKNLCELR